MGCIVNGPGEARHADIGLAGGKNAYALFKNGKVIKTGKAKPICDEYYKKQMGKDFEDKK